MTRQMLVVRQSAGKYEARRIDAACSRFLAQVRLDAGAGAQEPEHAALHRVQQPHPDVEDRSGIL
jgi:hypothetical protein